MHLKKLAAPLKVQKKLEILQGLRVAQAAVAAKSKKTKWVKSKRRREKEEKKRKEERLNDGDNNGQATHGARKYAWRTQAAWAKNQNKAMFEALHYFATTQLINANCHREVSICLTL